MGTWRAVGLLIVTSLAAAAASAANQEDPAVCDPAAAPIVVEQRRDGLVVAHVEFAAPLLTGCTAFPVQSMTWSVTRAAADGSGIEAFPFRHPTSACGLPRFPTGCTDESRVVVRPRGASLYVIRLEVLRLDGELLVDEILVRRGRRPPRAR